MASYSASSQSTKRRIGRLLVANRGEIATRIIQAAREAAIETFALFTANDTNHALSAAHRIELSSPAAYFHVATIVSIAKEHRVDAIHPGYGFLSESPQLVKVAWEDARISVVGPGWEILERTGDKLAAKSLAQECGVPTLPATLEPTRNTDDVNDFMQKHGFPIMLKAVDGGGGKGIRLVRNHDDLEHAFKRATAESPSGQVFVEKAAVDGFRHIEVQIIGDGTDVMHLWERECSIQRRYQKVIEIAPSSIADREFVAQIIRAAVQMAEHIHYKSLGTFEFLVNPITKEYFFMEINPRLQVEHTVTECISKIDIVSIQLQIAQGMLLSETALRHITQDPIACPGLHSVQLRVMAENVKTNWSLSIGKTDSFRFPTGNGIRIDTALVAGHPAVVRADFDSLIAKIIVTGMDWPDTVSKCRRAIADADIKGVTTNIDILRSIVASEDFGAGHCDLNWLEKNIDLLSQEGSRLSATLWNDAKDRDTSKLDSGFVVGSNSSTLLRKGDAWAISLAPVSSPGKRSRQAEMRTHYLKLTRVLRNEFPSSLRAEVEYAMPGLSQPLNFTIHVSSTTASGAALITADKHRRGNMNDPHHIVIPFSGKLVEVLVDEGDVVTEGQVICVVRQMKMELEVRTKRSGTVIWVTEAEDGEDIAEGILAAELEDVQQQSDRAKL